MNRKQMLKALGQPPTLVKALAVSIKKFTDLPRLWPRLISGKAEDHYPEKPNCAMCEYILYRRQDCDYCPLGAYPETQCDSRKSFYKLLCKAIDKKDRRLFMIGRNGMLLALKTAKDSI